MGVTTLAPWMHIACHRKCKIKCPNMPLSAGVSILYGGGYRLWTVFRDFPSDEYEFTFDRPPSAVARSKRPMRFR